jgi:hypothetical protein
MSSGYVYVLSNKAMPGLLKIGHTTRNSGIRKEELYTTGVPAKFEVEIEISTDNALNLERKLQSYFRKFRYTVDREFFQCEIEFTVREIKKYLESGNAQFDYISGRASKKYLTEYELNEIENAKKRREAEIAKNIEIEERKLKLEAEQKEVTRNFVVNNKKNFNTVAFELDKVLDKTIPLHEKVLKSNSVAIGTGVTAIAFLPYVVVGAVAYGAYKYFKDDAKNTLVINPDFKRGINRRKNLSASDIEVCNNFLFFLKSCYNQNINGFHNLRFEYLKSKDKSLLFNHSDLNFYARGLLNVPESGWDFLKDEKKKFEWSFTAEGLLHLVSGEFIPNQFIKESKNGDGYFAYDYQNFISHDQIKY